MIYILVKLKHLSLKKKSHGGQVKCTYNLCLNNTEEVRFEVQVNIKKLK